MVHIHGKRIELRKRKPSKKEKKKEEHHKEIKKFKEKLLNFRLSIAIFLLIGANLIFLISYFIHSFATKGTTGAIKPSPNQVLQPEKTVTSLEVEVLNGCGMPGIAKTITDYLRKKNIDVVYYGNFESNNISETLVIDRRDYTLRNAKIIGKIIGVEENRMFPQISPQRQLDVTIILGRNYSKLKAFQ